jgi:hypothetical protein
MYAKTTRCKIFVVLLYLLILLDNAWAAPITAQDARNVVTGWLNLDSSPLNTSLGSQIQKVERHNDSRGQPIYYVVRLRPSGVVIVSGDDLVEPIIAFLSGDDFEASDKHPIGAMVITDLPKRINEARNIESDLKTGRQLTEFKKADEARSKWILLLNCSQAGKAAEFLKSMESGGVLEMSSLSSVDDVRVAPLIQSKWNQGNVDSNACYNWYTPRVVDSNVVWEEGNSGNYVCGCVATAMAQIMRYHEYPTAGIGTIERGILVAGISGRIYRETRGGDGSGGPYDWNNMPLIPDYSITTTQRKAIGSLCYDIGVCLGATYSASGTSAILGSAFFTNYFQYTYAKEGSSSYYLVDINSNLDANHPVARSINIDGVGIHAVVIDGYGYNNSTMYHHINYGWGGTSDAWANFDPTFIYVCNIFTSGTGDIISGRIMDIHTGQPISGATVTATAPGAYYQTVTNDKGIYALAKIEVQQEYTISATKTGYWFVDQVVDTNVPGRTLGNLWGIDFEWYEPIFYVKNSSGEPTALIDEVGNLFLKGELSEGSASVSPDADELVVMNAAGTSVVAVIDMSTGDMQIAGIMKTTLRFKSKDFLNTNAVNFIIKDSSGNVKAFINYDGDLYFKGEVYEESLP